ncbi:MAG: metal ABC transporter ATP-binding protein [Verrucomicrobiales bacterium]
MAVSKRDKHLCWGADEPCPDIGNHRLEVSDLTITYGETLAVDRLSFGAECGSRVALLGPNGAGKSSLLKALAGVLRPKAGTVLWRQAPIRAAHHEIAYLPQRGEIDWSFPVTVRGLVEMGRFAQLGNWRRFRNHDRDVVARAIDAMEMGNLKERPIAELSGGQQQRTFIARALAQEAHVLLLDEPFAGLDKPAQDSLGNLLGQLAGEGRLLIASHHDLETASGLFDEGLLLNRQAIASGSIKDVLSEEHLAVAYGASTSPRTTR